MKKPRNFPVLLILSLIALAFVTGVFTGRNLIAAPMTVSVPEEIRMPAPVPQMISLDGDPSKTILVPVNINTATAEELSTLPGIGEELGSRIVAYREANGAFTHTEQLTAVPGIGEARLEAILSYITIGGTP